MIVNKNRHLPALSKQNNIDIVTFYNISREKAIRIKEMFNWKKAEIYIDYYKLLQIKLDAVYVLKPKHTDFEITFAVMKSGKYILGEKPMEINLEEAKKWLMWHEKLTQFCYFVKTIESIYSMNGFIKHLLGRPKKLVHNQYLIPFPGTPLVHSCLEEGVVIEDETFYFMPTNLVYIPNSFLNQYGIKKQRTNQHQFSEMTASYIKAVRKFGFKQIQLMIIELFESLDGSLMVAEVVEIYIIKKILKENLYISLFICLSIFWLNLVL